MKLTLKETKKEAQNVTSFIFESEEPLEWQAGQFLTYTLNHQNPDDRKEERYFTISSAPHEEHIMLTTRFSEKGSSFKNALKNMKLGDTLEAVGPEGDFLVTEPEKEHIFVAGGIGVTPYRAILLDLDAKGIPIKGKLLYGNNTEGFVFKSELDVLAQKHAGFEVVYILAPEMITDERIKEAASDPVSSLFYVSGPEPMVEAFEKSLPEAGIPEAHIKRDYFPGYVWPLQ